MEVNVSKFGINPARPTKIFVYEEQDKPFNPDIPRFDIGFLEKPLEVFLISQAFGFIASLLGSIDVIWYWKCIKIDLVISPGII